MPELFDVDEPRQPRRLVLPSLPVPDGRSTEARRQREAREVSERLRQANTRPKDLTTVRQRMALTPTGTPEYMALAREAEELERQAGSQAAGFGAVASALPHPPFQPQAGWKTAGLGPITAAAGGALRAAAETPAAQAIGSFARGRPYEPRPPTFQPQTTAEAVGAMVPSFISPPYQSPEELAREPGWSQAAMALTPVISGAGATLPQVMANVRAGQYAAGRGLQRGAGAVGRELVREVTPGPGGLVPGSPGFAKVSKGGKAVKPPSPIAAKAAQPPKGPAVAPVASPAQVVQPPRPAAEVPAGIPEAAGRVTAPQAATRPQPLPSGAVAPPVEPPKPPVAQAAPPPGPPDDPITRLTTIIHSPESLNLSKLTVEMRRREAGRRIAEYQRRLNEMIGEGTSVGEAERQAREELRGVYERPPGTITEEMANEFVTAAEQRVHDVLAAEPWEELSTMDALRNALMGQGIPREVGVKAGSAYTRLSRVFPPDVLDAIAKEQPLKKSIDDALLKAGTTPEQWREWTRPLPSPFEREQAEQLYSKVLLPPEGAFKTRTPQEMHATWLKDVQNLEWREYKRPLPSPFEREQAEQFVSDILLPGEGGFRTRTPSEIQEAWLKDFLEPTTRQPVPPTGRFPHQTSLFGPEPSTVPHYEAPIETALNTMQGSLIPQEQRHLLVRILKEVGMTAVDVGNALRAIKSSVDFSWWRQQIKFIPRAAFDRKYRDAFVDGNIQAIKALFSQKAADDAWKAIQNDPLYIEYEKFAAEGYDFLRPLDLPLDKEYWRGVEEYGYLAANRPIGRLVSKLPNVKVSQRSFVTGANVMNWRLYKNFREQMLDISHKVAVGEIKLPVGKEFSVQQNMRDFARLLSNFTGRAHLGRSKVVAKELSALFFAPRLALGVLLSPTHMFSRNPYIRREAIKNMLSYVSGIGGVVLAGSELGLWETSFDPNNADFGKIRIGNMRIDPWGGTQQYLVLAARLAPRSLGGGRYASSETGLSRPAGTEEALTSFVRGKLAPAPALALETKTGKTFGGAPVDYTSPSQWAERVGPFNPMAIYEAGKRQGLPAAAIAAPFSTVGMGVQTYGRIPAPWRAEFQQYAKLPSNDQQAKAQKVKTRAQYRKANPELNAKLYIAGEVESVETGQARALVVKLILENKVNPEEVPGLQAKEFESDGRKKLRLWILRALGPSASPQRPAPIAPGWQPPVVPGWEKATPSAAPTVAPRLPPIYPQSGPRGEAYDQMMGIR